MAFNHYSKMRRILDLQPDGWVIRRIDAPTTAKNFKGETVKYDHYYRIYANNGEPIKYCKFQQLDRLAQALQMPVEYLPLGEKRDRSTPLVGMPPVQPPGHKRRYGE